MYEEATEATRAEFLGGVKKELNDQDGFQRE
jgi:hypothetical protein